ncbi:MAG: imidazoleglycerol-phosphate dehydratase HisB [Lachnospiraceae bacterium]|nr:imidazoleglycerol-phosphate dehydratase HisB [Lachnospiraceae bacterium]
MRIGTVSRKTKETDIQCEIVLDGTGKSEIKTGIGFFEHMLNSFARHGLFDLKLSCDGDLRVDCHHSIEDCGIVLGEALEKAAGDKKGIRRYGHIILPMDEALVLCAVDFGGRPYLSFDLEFPQERCGEMDMAMVREFFYALSYSAGMNIHLKQLSGGNSHHIAEAAFKAYAKALRQAVELDGRIGDVLSTKGSL